MEMEVNPAADPAPIDLGQGVTATLVTRPMTAEEEADLAATLERLVGQLVRDALDHTEGSSP